MKEAIVIQARMSSSRLPGKTLRQYQGKTLLHYQLERLHKSIEVKNIVVATSTDSSDDAIVDFCSEHDICCYRGSLENVASRFKEVIETHGIDTVIRFCADRPFFDSRLLDQGIRIFRDGGYDLVTNTIQPSFPRGETLEIFKARVFLSNYGHFTTSEELEHVTHYFYKNQEKFKIYSLVAKKDYHHINLCVDTEEDFKRFTAIVDRMTKPYEDYSWEEIVQLYGEL